MRVRRDNFLLLLLLLSERTCRLSVSRVTLVPGASLLCVSHTAVSVGMSTFVLYVCNFCVCVSLSLPICASAENNKCVEKNIILNINKKEIMSALRDDPIHQVFSFIHVRGRACQVRVWDGAGPPPVKIA